MNFKTTRLQPFGLLIEPVASVAGSAASRATSPKGDLRSATSMNLNQLSVETLRELFWEEQLLVLRGFNGLQSAEDFPNYCEQFGEISLWPFGKVLELLEQKHPEDHIFDNNYVPLHWDGMYRPQIPEFQIFHCVQSPRKGDGGRTTFSNTRLALKNASEQERALWGKVTGHYQRKMEFYDSKTVSPIITKHPRRDFEVIRYNEPPRVELRDFVNPPILEFKGLSESELLAFHSSLKEALYSSKNFYAHEWQSGDLVIADNYTLLHGRESFVTKTPRHLRRVHVLGNPPLQNPGLEYHR